MARWVQTSVAEKAVGLLAYAYFQYAFGALIMFVGSLTCRFPSLAARLPSFMTLHRACADPVLGGKGFSFEDALINIGLFAVFAIQHNVMARESFKRSLKSVLPASVERSLFIILACITIHALLHFWRPMTGIVWALPAALHGPVWALHAVGWAIGLISTFAIDHWELAGLSTAFGKRPESKLVVRGFYAVVRHPLHLGNLVAFWAAPVMTHGRLLLSAIATAWVVYTVYQLEEPELVDSLGNEYRKYQQEVPALCPFWPMSGAKSAKKRY